MGIKDLTKFLEEKKLDKDAKVLVPLKDLSGYAIAIDANVWMYRAESGAMKSYLSSVFVDVTDLIPIEPIIRVIISQMYGLLEKFILYNITPVWIFDGPAHPEKEKAAKMRRKIEKISKKENIEAERKRIIEMSPLERTTDVIANFKKMLLQNIRVGGEEIDAVFGELTSLGIPCFIAPYDSEILCSALSREKKVIGVFSNDSDCYASGARAIFKSFSAQPTEDGLCFETIIPSVIHENMGMDLRQFRDFCIMLQCDFNVRIPGLGPVNAYRLLQRYGNDLDALMEAEPHRDWELLNVHNSRELLHGPSETCIDMSELFIDRQKWNSVIETKDFFLAPPETDPILVECIDEDIVTL